MATTIKGAFDDYRSRLEITDRQTALVSSRRKNVVDALSASLTLHTTKPSALIGSYDRNTLTRYLSEGDVDVLVVLNYGVHKGWDNAAGTEQVLDRFKAILDQSHPNTKKRRDRNCITMSFPEFRIDVVPAFAYDAGHYQIPDTYERRWVQTDPLAFAQKMTAVNQAMNGTFIPLVKMVKGWNRNQGWPISSFHLECLMYEKYRTYTKGFTYQSMLDVFFNELERRLSTPVFEPVRRERVDLYMDAGSSPTRRDRAKAKSRAAAATATKAQASEAYPPIAIPIWKGLLGEFFPSYG